MSTHNIVLWRNKQNCPLIIIKYPSGSGCSKVTTLLDNVSLKFLKLISQIYCYFLLKNVRISYFPTKNNGECRPHVLNELTC